MSSRILIISYKILIKSSFYFKEIDVGFVSHIYAMRLTHTGEDGFMLYIPSEVKFDF